MKLRFPIRQIKLLSRRYVDEMPNRDRELSDVWREVAYSFCGPALRLSRQVPNSGLPGALVGQDGGACAVFFPILGEVYAFLSNSRVISNNEMEHRIRTWQK